MSILTGPQGIGKSTYLATISLGWFNDSIRTFEGKEASEQLQGTWVVEIGELEAFRRTDIARIKQYLSIQYDRFRAAYGRNVKEVPRKCVFFGTTNSSEFLQDRTGNRRFWPVECGVKEPAKNVFKDLQGETLQILAEAVVYWRLGEKLYLSYELEAEARKQQEAHREVGPREGIILDFIEKHVPEGWHGFSLEKRITFDAELQVGEKVNYVQRDRVCALEIWCEAFDGLRKHFRYSDAAEINAVLNNAPGWKRTKNGAQFGYCGLQRGYERIREGKVGEHFD